MTNKRDENSWTIHRRLRSDFVFLEAQLGGSSFRGVMFVWTAIMDRGLDRANNPTRFRKSNEGCARTEQTRMAAQHTASNINSHFDPWRLSNCFITLPQAVVFITNVVPTQRPGPALWSQLSRFRACCFETSFSRVLVPPEFLSRKAHLHHLRDIWRGFLIFVFGSGLPKPQDQQNPWSLLVLQNQNQNKFFLAELQSSPATEHKASPWGLLVEHASWCIKELRFSCLQNPNRWKSNYRADLRGLLFVEASLRLKGAVPEDWSRLGWIWFCL